MFWVDTDKHLKLTPKAVLSKSEKTEKLQIRVVLEQVKAKLNEEKLVI